MSFWCALHRSAHTWLRPRKEEEKMRERERKCGKINETEAQTDLYFPQDVVPDVEIIIFEDVDANYSYLRIHGCRYECHPFVHKTARQTSGGKGKVEEKVNRKRQINVYVGRPPSKRVRAMRCRQSCVEEESCL